MKEMNETQNENEQSNNDNSKLKELKAIIRLLREERRLKNLPTLWFNNDLIEIHFINKTIIAQIISIDKKTSREDSDNLAIGSGFKQIEYTTSEVLK